MKKCYRCDLLLARVYCEVDETRLCKRCDEMVHGGSSELALHPRTILCYACQSPIPRGTTSSNNVEQYWLIRYCNTCRYLEKHDHDLDDGHQENELGLNGSYNDDMSRSIERRNYDFVSPVLPIARVVQRLIGETDSIGFQTLSRSNYTDWSSWMKKKLLAQGLWDIIEATSVDEVGGDYRLWSRNNAIVLLAIQNSCGQDLLSEIKNLNSAKLAWGILERKCKPREDSSLQANPPGMPAEASINYIPLLESVKRGNWSDALQFIYSHGPLVLREKISYRGKTALYVATMSRQVDIVKRMVLLMDKEDLEIKGDDGYTALAAAASYIGIKEMAVVMVMKNPRLVEIQNDRWKMIPVVLAILHGFVDMARYLYSVTPIENLTSHNSRQGVTLVAECIVSKNFDIAIHLLQRSPRLAFSQNPDQLSPLIALATMYSEFPSGSRLGFWQKLLYNFIQIQMPSGDVNHEFRVNIQKSNEDEKNRKTISFCKGLISRICEFLGIKQIYELTLTHMQSRKLLELMCNETKKLMEEELVDYRVVEALFVAVEKGVPEFVIELTKIHPELLWHYNAKRRNIFMTAALNRQSKIFNLLYGLENGGLNIRGYTTRVDEDCNTMLHLAAMPAPLSQLNCIAGAALKMQRELQWSKEVEKVVPPNYKKYLNKDGKTPQEVFTKSHEDLVKRGEKWMKGTATSCTVVAAFIVTIMFAALFTVPGGNNQTTGYPIFLHETPFMIFIISTAISFFFSSTSVLMFLGILTSCYSERDFLTSLPTKLIKGLFSLFFSIATMMLSFSVALLLMLRHQSYTVLPIVLLIASFPVSLFVWIQFPLLVQIITSTYGSGIFDKKVKPWF